jgi:5-methylthioribose kinase
MIILSEDNVTAYIQDHLADKLDFITDGEVDDVAVAGGGLVSAVFKAHVDGKNIYFKQDIPGRLDKVKKLVGGDVPEDAFVVWHDKRQYAEVKALQIIKEAVPDGFVPIVHYHDTDNNIMVLSEVCGENGIVLADVMNEEINVNHAEILGTNIARVANHTYGKYDALRDTKLEEKIKTVKYRYEVGEVWANITDSDKKDSVIKKVSDFVATSSKMNSVLVHGDYHERNILACGDSCGTYDLEESHWGDPVEDIGKLTASYILRFIYFDQIKKIAYDAAFMLLHAYFKALNIPEDRVELEKRLRIMIAGCLLLRVDGISSMWLPWVHDDYKKGLTRKLAVALVLEDKRFSIQTILEKNNLL